MNQLKKKCKVVMLSTDIKAEIGDLVINIKWGKRYPFYFQKSHEKYTIDFKSNPYQKQYLYILSEDEIKEGDWFIDLDIPHQAKPHKALKSTDLTFVNHKTKLCFKIIATTDYLQLERFGNPNDFSYLPHPSQSFIEKYISEYNKGNIITEVIVEYENKLLDTHVDKYGDLRNNKFENQLKINPKDNTITIKKVKDIFTKDDLEQAFNAGLKLGLESDIMKNPELSWSNKFFNKWIEENL